MRNLELVLAEDDADDDGCSEDGTDRGDGQGISAEAAEDIAQQQQVSPDKHGGWDSEAMGRGAQYAPRNMRHSHADKSDRTAEDRDTAREQSGGKDYKETRARDVDAESGGVVLAEPQSVKVLDEHHGTDHARKQDGEHDLHLRPAHAAQAAESPGDEEFERVGVGEVLQHIDQRARHRADHHADNKQTDIAADTPCDSHDEQQDKQAAKNGRESDSHAPCQRRSPQSGESAYSHERDSERGSAANAEYIRAGQRVAEECLHHKSADRQSGTRHYCSEHLGQAQAPENLPLHVRQAVGKGVEPTTARTEVEERQRDHHKRQDKEYERLSFHLRVQRYVFFCSYPKKAVSLQTFLKRKG